MSKIPATIITGFLGAGKTTLIRHLLNNAGNRRLALIINEFGDVGVDGDLLTGCNDDACPADKIIELPNGCICCTVADDFLPTMQALIDSDNPPDHIIIETSGLALPKPLVKAFQWPDIRTRTTVDGVVALIDADAVAAGRFASDEDALAVARAADPNLDHDSPLEELFEDQLACADLIILNKTDLIDDEALLSVEKALEPDIRDGVKIVRASHGAVDPSVLLGLMMAAEDDLDSRPSHHGAEGEDHDHDDFETFVMSGGVVADLDTLITRLIHLIQAHDILRVKGMVALEGKASRLVLQAVGPRIQHHFDRTWQPDEERKTQLVIIGQTGMDRHTIETAISAVIG